MREKVGGVMQARLSGRYDLCSRSASAQCAFACYLFVILRTVSRTTFISSAMCHAAQPCRDRRSEDRVRVRGSAMVKRLDAAPLLRAAPLKGL